ncbi:hypothetical protein P171DRAFT_491451 [Karstenula rhodostoma CBS 690.94]|uniref:Uncharacterized protein n=1 Tax=Karstenula rhodostoma CBS 690.94 TaxID=1392251 RepID=A0A9P4P7A4_9PLEO|nr:hypothetical protein P171DRAFT_491451 [Karstenula rhodostoma CBS 690.94]
MKLSLALATLAVFVSSAAANPVETTPQGACGPKWDWCDNLGEIRCECNGGHRLKCAQIWLDTGVTKFWNPVENCPKHGTKLQCIDGACVGP